jgi:acetyl-CoA C-acetyltransferase
MLPDPFHLPLYVSLQSRTPVGSFQGVLAKVPATQLGVAAVKGVLAASNVKPEQVEDLYFGQVLQGGAGQSPARQVVIGAGLPESTEATTINKVRKEKTILFSQKSFVFFFR